MAFLTSPCPLAPGNAGQTVPRGDPAIRFIDRGRLDLSSTAAFPPLGRGASADAGASAARRPAAAVGRTAQRFRQAARRLGRKAQCAGLTAKRLTGIRQSRSTRQSPSISELYGGSTERLSQKSRRERRHDERRSITDARYTLNVPRRARRGSSPSLAGQREFCGNSQRDGRRCRFAFVRSNTRVCSRCRSSSDRFSAGRPPFAFSISHKMV